MWAWITLEQWPQFSLCNQGIKLLWCCNSLLHEQGPTDILLSIKHCFSYNQSYQMPSWLAFIQLVSTLPGIKISSVPSSLYLCNSKCERTDQKLWQFFSLIFRFTDAYGLLVEFTHSCSWTALEPSYGCGACDKHSVSNCHKQELLWQGKCSMEILEYM